MEIEHIVSIVDVDEHGNPRFTCSVKPDSRDQWRYETNGDKLQRTVVRTSDRTETNGDICMNDNKLQEDFLNESMRPSYSEESSPKEPFKDSDLTEFYNALREVLSEEQINALTEDCLRLLGKKIF